jgi:hypothetical protein
MGIEQRVDIKINNLKITSRYFRTVMNVSCDRFFAAFWLWAINYLGAYCLLTICQ